MTTYIAAGSTSELELKVRERAMSAEQSNSGNETTLAMVASSTTSMVLGTRSGSTSRTARGGTT